MTIVIYNAGITLVALATIEEVSTLSLFLALLFIPVTRIETTASNLATSRDMMYILSLISKHLMEELDNLINVIQAVSLLLGIWRTPRNVYASFMITRLRGGGAGN